MLSFKISRKFHSENRQWVIISEDESDKNFRIVYRVLSYGHKYRLMTATKKDDDYMVNVYDDESRRILIKCTESVLKDNNISFRYKRDINKLLYIEAFIEDDECDFRAIRKIVGEALCRFSLKAVYEEFYVNHGEAVYLSDGVWLTADGKMIDRKSG